jgi:hypothetical protein
MKIATFFAREEELIYKEMLEVFFNGFKIFLALAVKIN